MADRRGGERGEGERGAIDLEGEDGLDFENFVGIGERTDDLIDGGALGDGCFNFVEIVVGEAGGIVDAD